ncbi:DegV family protein [Chloroflexota bacterium]
MVTQVAIVTDTTACIPRDQVAKYGIELVPLEFIFGDRVYRDGVDLSPQEFYALLRKSEKLPTTSGCMPQPFLEAYHKASLRAGSILCITIPAQLSGLYDSAKMATEMARESLHNTIIKVMDCATAAAGQGLVVLATAKAAASGKNLADTIRVARSVMKRVKLLATLDTLNYLVKGGRVPRVAALASSLLKIKPIFTVKDGDPQPVTNARTTAGALKRILKLMKTEVVKGQPLYAAVMHGDDLDKALTLKKNITSQFDCDEIFITEFTPAMGVHTGPGVVGVAFYSGSWDSKL